MRSTPPQVLITDLDNTLYDWVTFFATSFSAMVDDAVARFSLDKEALLNDLQLVHRQHHNSEQPFALLETTSLQERFPGKTRAELADLCRPSFDCFNEVRQRTLQLYPGVAETLRELSRRKTLIVGHTEASVANALFRLNKLGIGQYFDAIYAINDIGLGHPSHASVDLTSLRRKVRTLGHDQRKPDTTVLLDICRAHHAEPARAVYVGDSLSRDVGMASEAGLVAVWAQYGTHYDSSHWKQLVRVTHWTQEDVDRAENARRLYEHVRPDIVLHESYAELLLNVDFVPFVMPAEPR